MAKEEKKAPKLRFNGYTNDWERKELNNILKINSGRDYKQLNSGNIPVYGTGGYMLSVNDKLSDTDAVGIGRKGTIDKPLYLKAPFWTVDTLFYCTSKENSDVKFIYLLFQIINWKRYDESTGVPSLSKNTISNIKTYVPKIEEQDYISKLFFSLDNTLQLHERKYEELTIIKQALLQKLFPKKDEIKPEVRYENFSDAWEQRKLGEVVNLRGRIGFRGYKQTDLVDKGQGAISFSPADIDEFGNVLNCNNKYISWAKYDESPEIQIAQGDILFTKTASIGKIGYITKLREKATINPQIALITPLKNENGYFIFLSLRLDQFTKKVRNIIGGSSVPTLSQEKLKLLTFMYPDTSEQKEIGDFFKQLDSLIALHQCKLEKLKQLKKFLLQNMFI